MDKRWKYPFYVIAILLLVLWLFGCDRQSGSVFSLDVRVETAEGEPVEGADVGVRPCYRVDGAVTCGPQDLVRGTGRGSLGTEKEVKLASWTVRRKASDVVMSWTTSSETENAGFRIERRCELGFSQIAFVEGQGTTQDSVDYRFRHADVPPASVLTYRLVAIVLDGSRRVVGEPRSGPGPSFEPEIRGFSESISASDHTSRNGRLVSGRDV